MDARVLSTDGAEAIHRRAEAAPQDSEQLGRRLARELLDAGADRLLRLTRRTVGGR
jgi:porphobilinogen deaminase